jgi:hypothetical protein
VNIQRTEGVAALGIPRERMEAVGQEIAQAALTDPHWSKQRAYTITLAYQWGETPMTLGVTKHDDSSFQVLFLLDSEMEEMGFHKSEEKEP